MLLQVFFIRSLRPSEKRISIGAYDDDGTVQGAISVILEAGQYDCDWLYVHPECRGIGVGNELYDEILTLIGTTGLIYPLSASFEVSEEDMALYGFFLSRDDAEVAFSHNRFYIEPEEIMRSMRLKEKLPALLEEKDFTLLDKKEKKRVLEKIATCTVGVSPAPRTGGNLFLYIPGGTLHIPYKYTLAVASKKRLDLTQLL